MFLNSRRQLKTQGAVAVATTIGVLALGACDDNTARTDLRPEGPPDVLAVLVLNDSVNGLVEAATYCKDGDEKRPVLVGLPDFTTTTLCPEDPNESQPMATDASPDTFYVRIMFDELLDPTVEDLIPILDDLGLETGSYTGTIANTQPVTLKCTGVDGMLHDVPYDGYYSPSGNSVTWPVGPSLVIKQAGEFIIPTNSACEVTIKDFVKDKQGEPVPADQRGPFKFKVSPIKPLVIDPAPDSTIDAIQLYFDNPYMQFNTAVDPDSLCADEDGTGLCDPGTVAWEISPSLGGFCSVSGDPCNTTADCDAADPTDVCESLYAYSYVPFGGTPAEFGFGPVNAPETSKSYTITLKQGAKAKDQCGAETTFGAPSEDNNTSTTVMTRPFGLRNAGAFAPNTGDTTSAMRKPAIAWNNVVDFTTLDLSEWSMEPQMFIRPSTKVCTTNADCAATGPAPTFRGGECRTFGAPTNGMRCVANYTTTGGDDGNIIFRGIMAMNTEYTFTYKGGATIEDAHGVVYTNPADKVIKYKTQPAVAVTGSTPATGATITKAAPTSLTSITLSFNQAMVPSSLTQDTGAGGDYTITPAVTANATVVSPSAPCNESAVACTLVIQANYPPGMYRFVLKANDAKLTDLLGNEYVQAMDRVIQFTVQEAPPAADVPCLGS